MHTFDDVSLSAESGFVGNQWVDCHGGVTNVVKTARNVVKSVVKPRRDLRGGINLSETGPGLGSGMIGWALRQVVIWVGLATVVLVGYGYRGDILGVIERAGGDRGTAMATPAAGRPAAKEAAKEAASRSMTIRAGHGGHFLVDATVDGVVVRFLVDTGATRVVLSPEDAGRIGFHLRDRNFTERHRTAGGIVRAAPVTLRELRIGHLTVREVEASVNEAPIGISLLGMTFLNRLDGYEVRGDKLVLHW